MKKINYPLIISDCDGTLIDDEYKITDEVRGAINEYVEAGGIFAIITGRMLSAILPYVRELGLKGLVAAYQGTVIADIESGKIIKKGGLTAEQTLEVCRVLQEVGAKCNIYTDEKLYSDRAEDDELLKLYCGITGVPATSLKGETMVQFVQREKPFCQKITSLVMPDDRDELYEALNKRLGKKYDVTYSAKVLVEVSPMGDDKGGALKFIADEYGIPIEKTVAIGDNLNDLPMILAAGVGVAVGNAAPPLKNNANDVTLSNNEGAVAAVIRKYGFEQD